MARASQRVLSTADKVERLRQVHRMKVARESGRLAKRLSSILGSSTGEAYRDVIAGGWEGTDDATSTAPSDLINPNSRGQDAESESVTGSAFGDSSGISDMEGHPVDSSRDWTNDAVPENVQDKL